MSDDTYIDVRCIRPRLTPKLLRAFDKMLPRWAHFEHGYDLTHLIPEVRGARSPVGHGPHVIDGIVNAMFAELDERNMSDFWDGPTVPMQTVYPHLDSREGHEVKHYEWRFNCEGDARRLRYEILRQDSLAGHKLITCILKKLAIAIDAFDAGLEASK